MKTRSRLRFVLEGLEGLGLLAAALLTWPLLGAWARNWGSRHAERRRDWPGDDLVAPVARTTTRAITVDAPARAVWGRLVQLGLRRAGFYSYELLERLGGIPVTNVESVERDWQGLAVGDEVLLHPRAGIRVSKIAPERHVCFGVRTRDGRDVGPGSWSMYVVPAAEDACRLLVRGCFAPPARRSWWRRLLTGAEAALDAVMEQRMLRTIKRLGEAHASGGRSEGRVAQGV